MNVAVTTNKLRTIVREKQKTITQSLVIDGRIWEVRGNAYHNVEVNVDGFVIGKRKGMEGTTYLHSTREILQENGYFQDTGNDEVDHRVFMSWFTGNFDKVTITDSLLGR